MHCCKYYCNCIGPIAVHCGQPTVAVVGLQAGVIEQPMLLSVTMSNPLVIKNWCRDVMKMIDAVRVSMLYSVRAENRMGKLELLIKCRKRHEMP